MTQLPSSLDSFLLTVVLAVLAIGLPILILLSIRFFWDRSLHLGRSKELEKLIWQLHRIASAMEHQMKLSFPAVQPGTEEPADLAFLQKPAVPATAAPVQQVAAAASTTQPLASASIAQSSDAPAPPPSDPQPQPAAAEQPAPADQSAEPSGFPPLVPHDPAKPLRQGGVNSMFGL